MSLMYHPTITKGSNGSKVRGDVLAHASHGEQGGTFMFQCNRTTRARSASVALVLCATLATHSAIAAPPTLQSIAITPAASSVSVGQKQYFTAKGTFNNGSTHILMFPELVQVDRGARQFQVLVVRSRDLARVAHGDLIYLRRDAHARAGAVHPA